MSLYRCAICGSPNVIKQESNDGFSYKKAIVGTAVFGSVGAVAGINGKKTTAFVCPDCGSSLPNPMDRAAHDMADVLMSMPPHLAQESSPAFISKYSYLQKQLEQASTANKYVIDTPVGQYANPANIKEDEFRAAATRTLHSLRMLQKYWLHHGPDSERNTLIVQRIQGENFKMPQLDIEQAKQAIKDFHVVYHGIAAYPHLVIKSIDDSLNSGLYYSHLMDAAIFYILTVYDELTVDELYDMSQSEKTLKRVFHALFGDKWKQKLEFEQQHSSWMNYTQKSLLPKKTWLQAFEHASLERYSLFKPKGRLKAETTLKVPFIVIDDTLYVRDSLSLDERFALDMPELANKIKENRRQHGNIVVPQQSNFRSDSKEMDYKRKINKLQGNIDEIYVAIAKLEKKIFGKAKAQVEITELKKEIERLNREIDTNKNAMKALEQEDIERFKLAKAEAEQKQNVLNQEYEELKKEKDAYASQHSIWIDAMTLPDILLNVPSPDTSDDCTSSADNSSIISVKEELKKLKELLDEGLITQEDYDAKKQQYLGL